MQRGVQMQFAQWRTGFVGADRGGTAHGLCGGEVAHEVVVSQHALDAKSQRDRHREGKALRHSHNLRDGLVLPA